MPVASVSLKTAIGSAAFIIQFARPAEGRACG